MLKRSYYSICILTKLSRYPISRPQFRVHSFSCTRKIMSNNPDQNAQGGKFTSKVCRRLNIGFKFRISQNNNNRSREGIFWVWKGRLILSEEEMQPKSESTRLEGPDGLVEYKGSDKLKGKKAIITGGEYVPSDFRFVVNILVLVSVVQSRFCMRERGQM